MMYSMSWPLHQIPMAHSDSTAKESADATRPENDPKIPLNHARADYSKTAPAVTKVGGRRLPANPGEYPKVSE